MTELINVEFDDIRVGDMVTAARKCSDGVEREFSAEVYEHPLGDLYLASGQALHRITFISATRPKPETCWNGDEIVEGKMYLVQHKGIGQWAALRKEGEWCEIGGGRATDQSRVKPLCAVPITPDELMEALA